MCRTRPRGTAERGRDVLRGALLVLFALAGSLGAHVGSIVYPIYELAPSQLPNLHDETLADWEDALPLASLSHSDFGASIDVVDPSDLACRVFLAWSNQEQRLYVGAERLDDLYHPSGDLMAVRVDGDHSGGSLRLSEEEELSEEERTRHFQSRAQVYLIFTPAGSDVVELWYSGVTSGWSDVPPWADIGTFEWGEAPSQFVIEMAVTPWDELTEEGPEGSRMSSLYPGKIIGFQLMMLDVDEGTAEGGAVQGQYSVPAYEANSAEWYGANYDADLWADGELVPCYERGCSGDATAVRSDSWGRIKASFR